MKSLFYLLIFILTLTSCVKYEQPPLLSLSGEYRIDKITYQKIDGSTTSDDMVYYPGDEFVNPNGISPLDSVNVGFTSISIDYSMMRFKPVKLVGGSTKWNEEYPYYVVGQITQYDLGYIKMLYKGTSLVLKIIEDGAESLVLRTTGQWADGSSGSDVSFTYVMTRVGP
jgi:hypothetical protein